MNTRFKFSIMARRIAFALVLFAVTKFTNIDDMAWFQDVANYVGELLGTSTQDQAVVGSLTIMGFIYDMIRYWLSTSKIDDATPEGPDDQP